MSSAQSEEELNKFLRGHRVLQMGLAFYRSHRISIKGLIHHSDRGSQYASSMYTDLLKANKIRISMTQCGDPLHNAMAERVNNIVNFCSS